MAYKRIVVGTDGSDTATAAVTHAAALAAAEGAELVIVTAYSHDEFAGQHLEAAREQAPDDVRWAITDVGQAEDRLTVAKAAARDAKVAKIRARAVEGDAASVLVETAQELLADLIVVGNRGMGAASRFLLGSVPNRVSHHAPCDILIVRTADK